MKIKTKLILSSTILATVTAVIVIIAFITSNMTEKRFSKIIEEDQKVIYNLTQLETLLTGISNDERGYLLTGDSTFVDSLKSRQESVSKLMKETKVLMTAEEDVKVFNQIETGYVIYTEAVTQVLNKLGYDTGFYKAVPFRVYEAAFKQEREIRNSFSTLIAEFTINKNEALAKQADEIASSSELQNMMIMLIGVAAVVYFAIQGYLLTRSIRPLNQMSDQLLRIADGGGDLVTRLNITTKDEIRAVADAYNKLVEGFRALVVQVQDTAGQVGTAASTLHSTTEEIRQASQQTSGIMEELAAGVENQLQDTEETTATVTDMAEGMKHITLAAQDVSGLAATANKLASEGEQAIIHTLNQMEGIRTSVDQSAQSVRALGEKASNIGAMGQIIIEIAEQTSLLALNASIEAARAGEHGRGFAVVAAEVRKLADQASNSSVEIRQFVHELQQDIYDLAGVMEQGTREVTEGMSVAQGAERAFKDIEQSVVELNEQIQGVTVATEQMNSGADDLVHAIRRIQEVTETTAGGTQSVSAATEEQLASMEEITNSVEDLNVMSGKLRQLMSGFKV
ncbi:methyl-accepting chemotaxis protein [Paenibacillus glucanolyticus]|jgi:methyl-accepting chemotaxis protein|uniref:methyl-accepting chemotaxis protein n=1 Tax=Paenibacillus TaxID=44249 RepID=UPI0003E28B97|nr:MULTISPECIES: methyl-accepting chemotaxis protein [Paenibacillus]ANA83247.1 chemotaxis protein [Paenibacillus glucanolyticus]AVV57660.1 methyl-accepting chemotaxis protein [Paenibacillus glucanolyticus]ETT34431.1 methyl-accepting chemotaxis sensory transducer [Paenibacillus sp. FSL R5-808]OMF83143.1 chemotaxis protein [Paenibacillus glucanolyticus]